MSWNVLWNVLFEPLEKTAEWIRGSTEWRDPRHPPHLLDPNSICREMGLSAINEIVVVAFFDWWFNLCVVLSFPFDAKMLWSWISSSYS
jgi:uncharacterized membrane protein